MRSHTLIYKSHKNQRLVIKDLQFEVFNDKVWTDTPVASVAGSLFLFLASRCSARVARLKVSNIFVALILSDLVALENAISDATQSFDQI